MLVAMRQWQRAGLGERAGEAGQDGQVGVQRDPLNTAYPQRQQRPLVLELAVLPLDGAMELVELLPAQRSPADERVQPAGPDPSACRGALAGCAAPLGRLPLGVGSGKGLPSCSQTGGRCLPALTAGVSRRGMTGWQPRASNPS
jgi:hypothetical protein